MAEIMADIVAEIGTDTVIALKHARAALATLVAVAALAPLSAQAQESDWLRWGPGNTTGAIDYDREFIKSWEKNPPKGFPTASSANIAPMKAAIKHYEDVVKAGGWQPIPDVKQMEGKSLQQGQTAPAVGLVRARLAASGDLQDASSSTTYFDGALEKAVKRFQASNGLTPTGIVDDRTASAMNVPADARLKQLKVNLGRVAELAGSRPKRYVIVNIPAAHVEAVEGNEVVSRHTGVVGKTERPTPLLRSAITNLNFNPMWTLPPTVITKDLIPKGADMQRRNQNVLVKYGIDAFDAAGKKLDPAKINWSSSQPQTLTYRQQPGKDNPLGFLKINFDSANSVYMHDTPSETLFGKNVRAASSGCVRVANIDVLAAWLLKSQGWTEDSVHKMRETGERKDVTLKQSVPLNFVYITAWATPDGVVQFRRDLYQRDGVGPIAASY
jgi:L,D-transpeptidase YcbB